MAGRVQVLAAGQAPWAAHHLAVVAADPESGRVLPAVDAQLDAVQQQAVGGYCAPLGVGDRRSGLVLADRHAGGRRQNLDEPRGHAITARPDGQESLLVISSSTLGSIEWSRPDGAA